MSTSVQVKNSVLKELALIVLVVLAVTLPFIAKPVHMDGTYFLDVAQVKQESLWQDYLADYDFGGEHFDRWRDTHPPFTAYYLAAVVYLAGGVNEVILHLSFLPFALLAGVSAYFIARRFVDNALFAALIVVAAPGFVVMASDLMSDLPVIAFWLAAVATFIYGADRQSGALLAACGAFLFLAFFTAYLALSLIPLLLLYAFLFKRLSLSNLLPIAAAAALFFAYLGAQWVWQGELPRLKSQHATSIAGPGLSRFFPKGSSLMLSLGGAIIFPPAILAIFWPRREQRWEYFGIVLTFAWVPALLALLGLAPWEQALQMAVLLPCAGLLLWGFLEKVSKKMPAVAGRNIRREWIFLSLWMAGVLFYIITIMSHASVKYMLVALMPAAILLADRLQQRWGRTRAADYSQAAIIVATVALALLVSAADYQLAAAYRDFVSSTPLDNQGKCWFTGEFGFRYYLEKKGCEYMLAGDDRPQAGDLVFQPIVPGPMPLGEELARRVEQLEDKALRGNLPIRIINPPAGAGFYGHRWGLLPYSLSTSALDHVNMYRVTK